MLVEVVEEEVLVLVVEELVVEALPDHLELVKEHQALKILVEVEVDQMNTMDHRQMVVPVSSSSPILLDNHQKTLYNIQVFNILVTLGMKTLSVVGEVSWWYNEEGVYTLLFSIIN